MAGWHHRLNGHEFEWTLGDGDGQGGLTCCNSWGLKESDMTEWLNWTELNENILHSMYAMPCGAIEEIYVYVWLIVFTVQQKLTQQYCKSTIFQLKKKKVDNHLNASLHLSLPWLLLGKKAHYCLRGSYFALKHHYKDSDIYIDSWRMKNSQDG